MSHDPTGIFGILDIKDSREIGVRRARELQRLARANKLGRIIGYRLNRNEAIIELIGKNGVIEIDAKSFTPVRASMVHRVGKRVKYNPRRGHYESGAPWRLDPVERWMVKRQLEYVKTKGLRAVVDNLRRQGYHNVADAVRREHASRRNPRRRRRNCGCRKRMRNGKILGGSYRGWKITKSPYYGRGGMNVWRAEKHGVGMSNRTKEGIMKQVDDRARDPRFIVRNRRRYSRRRR